MFWVRDLGWGVFGDGGDEWIRVDGGCGFVFVYVLCVCGVGCYLFVFVF